MKKNKSNKTKMKKIMDTCLKGLMKNMMRMNYEKKRKIS